MLQELRKLLVIQLFLILKTEALDQKAKVNVFRVNFKSQIAHNSL